MNRFEYLATLFSVVAGLALTRGLSGLAKTVHNRHSVKPSGVHLAWTCSVLMWLINFWWFTFFLAPIEEWTVPLFLFVLVYGAFIYFLIALLYPDKRPSAKDHFDYFIETRMWFFGTFVLLGCIDIADTAIKARIGAGLPPLIPYSIIMVSWLVFGAIGAFTSNRLFHTFFAYTWLVVFGAWAFGFL
jgi:hypothetical protein